MAKKSGYVRKKPNFHNMGIGALLDFIRRASGAATFQEDVEEARSWVRRKGGNDYYDSEVIDSDYKGRKGRNF